MFNLPPPIHRPLMHDRCCLTQPCLLLGCARVCWLGWAWLALLCFACFALLLVCDVPCRAVPCRTVPCRTVPRRAVPCRAVLCLPEGCRMFQEADLVLGPHGAGFSNLVCARRSPSHPVKCVCPSDPQTLSLVVLDIERNRCTTTIREAYIEVVLRCC